MAEAEKLLKVHHLRPAAGAKKKKMRVGRGDGSKGKTAGRGTKGTKARGKVPVAFEGGQMPIHMRLPKLHGFKNPFKKKYEIVNVVDLEQKFPKGGKIGIKDLIDSGLVKKNKYVKILGNSPVKEKFDIEVNAISNASYLSITKVGGDVKLVKEIFTSKDKESK